MSDRDSYIQAGVKHAWMIVYDGGEIVTEFNRRGYIIKLSDIEWERVVEFCAYNIHDASEEPTPIIRLPFTKSSKYIWFHRSTLFINNNGRYSQEYVADYFGVQDTQKICFRFEPDGSIKLIERE